MTTHAAVQAEEQYITSFDNPSDIASWRSVNDGVMGGISEGNAELTESGTLLFSGNLSLENNGGFASIRSEPRTMNLAGMTCVAVKVRGDGRTYWLELRKARQRGATSYRAYLPTKKGEWTETTIPFEDFRPQSYGRQIDAPPIDPSSVSSIGFMLADKKEGPFALEVDHIKAVSYEAMAEQQDQTNTIVDVAVKAGSFQTLLAAAKAADLAEALAGEGPFTVFAPTDEAFARLPAGALEELLKPENKERLGALLKYHVLAGRVSLARALELGQGRTLQGDMVEATFEDGSVRIGSATLVQADLAASNGLIHVIDEVLMPPQKVSVLLTPAALIELAIERGVPLFNHGDPRACSAVYEVTCEALRLMPSLHEQSSQDLAQALEEMSTEESHEERAWILRRALDRVHDSLLAAR